MARVSVYLKDELLAETGKGPEDLSQNLKPMTETFYRKLRGSLKGKGVLRTFAKDCGREKKL